MIQDVFKLLRKVILVSFLLVGIFANLIVAEALTPTPQVRIGENEIVAKTADGINSVQQFNLTGAAYAGLISNILYFYDASSTDSYLYANLVKADAGTYTLDTITDEDGTVYLTEPLQKWRSFWLRTNKDVNIAFPYETQSTISESITLSGNWNFISIPLTPKFQTPSSYTGFKFYHWVNTPGTGNMSTTALLQPGRSFWVNGNGTLSIPGEGTKRTKNFLYNGIKFPQYMLRLPAEASDLVGDYMIGNPFTNEISMGGIWIEQPYNPNYIAGKIVSESDINTLYNEVKNIKLWSIGLTLSSNDGYHVDASNVAGVIESVKDLSSYFIAPDLVAPISDYIRLAFVNPNDASSLLCSDIRGPNEVEYEWKVELSTTISAISTKLIMANFKQIPAEYSLTLTDSQTGTVYPLTGDATFDVTLTSSTPKMYVLTATRQKPTAVADATPTAVGLDIFPNPFNPSTTISFDVKKAGVVNLGVYNINGQLVDTLINSPMTAGSHQVVWNAAKNSSGVYLVKVTSNGFTDTKKVTFMK